MRTTAQLAGWPTPLARDGDKLDATLPAIMKRARDGRELGLAMVARMAGWATPCAMEPNQAPEVVTARKRRMVATCARAGHL